MFTLGVKSKVIADVFRECCKVDVLSADVSAVWTWLECFSFLSRSDMRQTWSGSDLLIKSKFICWSWVLSWPHADQSPSLLAFLMCSEVALFTTFIICPVQISLIEVVEKYFCPAVINVFAELFLFCVCITVLWVSKEKVVSWGQWPASLRRQTSATYKWTIQVTNQHTIGLIQLQLTFEIFSF